jgi:hypothetical protein
LERLDLREVGLIDDALFKGDLARAHREGLLDVPDLRDERVAPKHFDLLIHVRVIGELEETDDRRRDAERGQDLDAEVLPEVHEIHIFRALGNDFEFELLEDRGLPVFLGALIELFPRFFDAGPDVFGERILGLEDRGGSGGV